MGGGEGDPPPAAVAGGGAAATVTSGSGSVYYDAASSLRSLSLNSSGGGASSTRAPAPAAEAKAAAEGAVEAVEGGVESDPRPWMRTHELRTEGSFDAAVRTVAAARDAGERVDADGDWLWVRARLAADLADERGDADAAKEALALAERATDAAPRSPEAHLAGAHAMQCQRARNNACVCARVCMFVCACACVHAGSCRAQQKLARKRTRAIAHNHAHTRAHAMLIAVAIGAGRVQEIPGTGIQARVKLARRIREHCDTCLELCREKFGDPPVGDEFFTTYTCLMVLGKWHHGLASLPSVHKFVVRTVFGKMPHYSYEEAAAAHKKQLEMHPHIPLPRMELGRVLIGMGDKAAAAAHLDAFLEQVRRAHTRQHTHAHTVHPEAQHTNEHTRDPMHVRCTCLARTRAREGIAVRDAAALAPARLTRGSRAAARARGRAGPRRQVQRQALQAPPRGRRHAQGDRRGAQAGGESDALRGWLGEKVMRVEAPHFRRGSARARTHVRVCAHPSRNQQHPLPTPTTLLRMRTPSVYRHRRR